MSTYHDKVMCYLVKLDYDFDKHIAQLYTEGYCDMGGCISFFMGIDPKVERIITYEEGILDTQYLKSNGKWRALTPEGKWMCEPFVVSGYTQMVRLVK